PEPESKPEPEPETEILYTVKFEFGYNNIIKEVSTTGELFAPETPIRQGYELLGWFFDDNLWRFDNVVSADITLVAKWQPVNFKISYVLAGAENNADNPDSYTVEDIESINLYSPNCQSALFVGWYLDDDFSEPFAVKEPYTDLTVYAKFIFPSEKLIYEKIGNHYYVSGYSGEEDIILIPDTYLGLSVVGILDNAFSEASASRIIAPNSLKYVSKDAFLYCDNYKPNEYGGVNYLESLDNQFFALISHIDGTMPEIINIRNECVVIADYALDNIPTLNTVTGGNSIKYIGNSAFKGARNLTDIDIFDTVVEIGENAFYSCAKLTRVEFGDGFCNMGKGAFAYCEGLRYLKLSKQLLEIPERAFDSCKALETVIIKSNMKFIGVYAFRGIPDITKIYYSGTPEEWGEIELNSNFEMNLDSIFFNHMENG
ncbi:MAG: leucine-rich repeat protein, partial [Clostridia bacterium]|nr:leucine-rich repeat protein [Clostridia bacterium]